MSGLPSPFTDEPLTCEQCQSSAPDTHGDLVEYAEYPVGCHLHPSCLGPWQADQLGYLAHLMLDDDPS